MSALSRLITKCTKRQLQIAITVEQISSIMDRTIAFAEAEKPYISEEEIDSLLPYIPVTEPEPEPAPESEQEPETESEPDYSSMTKAELLALCAERGVEAYESWTKQQIIAALVAAEGAV